MCQSRAGEYTDTVPVPSIQLQRKLTDSREGAIVSNRDTGAVDNISDVCEFFRMARDVGDHFGKKKLYKIDPDRVGTSIGRRQYDCTLSDWFLGVSKNEASCGGCDAQLILRQYCAKHGWTV